MMLGRSQSDPSYAETKSKFSLFKHKRLSAMSVPDVRFDVIPEERGFGSTGK